MEVTMHLGKTAFAGLLMALSAGQVCPASSAGFTKRAVVVGIDDYSASDLLPQAGSEPGPDRRVRDLRGAVNDAEAMYQVLTGAFGFAPDRVRLLRDQEATRQAIVDAIREVLIEPAGEGDPLVFFFAGHGSQVVNSGSDEDDGKDESLVPADSRAGARDLRDKELRRLFNRALKRRARLTVVLDSCHSGSAVRTSNGLAARSVKLDPRDVEDGGDAGPPLEQGGALVLAAAQEFQLAAEVWDEEDHKPHGAFSLALLRSLSTLSPGEPSEETFARTRARLRILRPQQEPVISGSDDVRSVPLFGDRADQRAGRTVVAVERLDEEGGVLLQGGWINGLTVGSRLESVREPRVVLQVTELDALTRSRARVLHPEDRTAAEVVGTAEVFAVSGWAVPPGPPLPVRVPVADAEVRRQAISWIRKAKEAGVSLSDDPSADPPPTHVLRWREEAWWLTGPEGEPRSLGGAPDPWAVLESLGRGDPSARLFVELPVPPELAGALEIGPGTDLDKVEPDGDERSPHLYVLAGRPGGGSRMEFAWVSPGPEDGGRDRSPMPLRGRWHGFELSSAESVAAAAHGLMTDGSGLARIHSWLHLESRGRQDFPYRLALVAAGTGREVTSGDLVAGERYGLALEAGEQQLTGFVRPHYVYVFTIDSFGKRTLLFPPQGRGNVGNRFPARMEAPRRTRILLGPNPLFAVAEPFGLDTYYLLATAEALPAPWVLDGRGVRDVRKRPSTALEELLVETGSDKSRNETLHVPANWFVERLFLRSVPPGASIN